MINIGVIGCGYWGPNLIRNINSFDGTSLKWVCDLDTDRLNKINWKTYYNSWPFNESALALYEWAPIADELKTLDRKIVLNSMILKWDNIKEEFKKLISI